MSIPLLKIAALSKRYGDFVALAPTHLDVAQGEFLTLLGPSGSGKTTLLSLIAGLAVPDEGQVFINGKDVTHGAPHERDIGMVFQNYALFPHMTIGENIAFPLTMRKVPVPEAQRRVQEALEMVHLPHVADRLPRELSGGQQQRVALARCMVYRPSIILMDEPLGALDKKLRDQMQLEIKRIHREIGTTIVYVTHDQEEAMTLSDRICLMNGGAIEQLGAPQDLYFRPRSLFVADFLGESNLLSATVQAVGSETVSITLHCQNVSTEALSSGQPAQTGQSATLMLRPQNLSVHTKPPEKDDPGLAGTLLDVMVTGSLTKLYLDVGSSTPLVAAFATQRNSTRYQRGQRMHATWQATDAVVLGA